MALPNDRTILTKRLSPGAYSGEYDGGETGRENRTPQEAKNFLRGGQFVEQTEGVQMIHVIDELGRRITVRKPKSVPARGGKLSI